MRYQFLISSAILLICTEAYVSKTNPLKTKKYKCIEIEEENHYEATHYSWRKEDEELRSIGKMSAGDGRMQTTTLRPLNPATPVPHMPTNIPRDSHNRPLILSPQHCNQVQQYATAYGVKDVLSWVKRNCHFAKMFVPDATCEEINILVASCYKNKYLV